MVLQGHMTNKNSFISTTRAVPVTKFDRMMSYLDGFLPIKSNHPLIK